MLHALSFDVEEYFQVANLRGHFARADWERVPSRLEQGLGAILSALEAQRAHATFFWLGWVAERHPQWVRRCLEAGHEIASHGYEHAFLQELGPAGLERDLERTEEALVAAGAPRPAGFRASTFTLTRATWWAFDVLARRGYRYDSSVHPIRHPLYGVPGFEPGISLVDAGGGRSVIEFPVSTWRFLGANLPVGGGGYFRLLPYTLSRWMMERVNRVDGEPAIFYFHPWELDPGQPRLPGLSAKARLRHYLNIDRMEDRVRMLTHDFAWDRMDRIFLNKP